MSSSERRPFPSGPCPYPGEGLDDHVADVVDDIGVVAGQTDHGVGIAAAVEEVVIPAPTADQQVVAGAAVKIVVAGAAEDQVVAGAAGDDVVDALLADHEVIGDRGREIDAASVAVGRIKPADQVVVGAEQVACEGLR